MGAQVWCGRGVACGGLECDGRAPLSARASRMRGVSRMDIAEERFNSHWSCAGREPVCRVALRRSHGGAEERVELVVRDRLREGGHLIGRGRKHLERRELQVVKRGGAAIEKRRYACRSAEPSRCRHRARDLPVYCGASRHAGRAARHTIVRCEVTPRGWRVDESGVRVSREAVERWRFAEGAPREVRRDRILRDRRWPKRCSGAERTKRICTPSRSPARRLYARGGSGKRSGHGLVCRLHLGRRQDESSTCPAHGRVGGGCIAKIGKLVRLAARAHSPDKMVQLGGGVRARRVSFLARGSNHLA
mmetsp:Transcript_4022/g.9098  ORF Transcript_4022/g.9098 Transcript_4022/m.9098 type:complete len:305 (-) Transcript_4022:2151-3065(-)